MDLNVRGAWIVKITENKPHYAKTDLNKKSGTMHQTLIFFNLNAQGLIKTKYENLPMQKMGVTS